MSAPLPTSGVPQTPVVTDSHVRWQMAMSPKREAITAYWIPVPPSDDLEWPPRSFQPQARATSEISVSEHCWEALLSTRLNMYTGYDFDPTEYPVCGEKYQSPVDIELNSTEYNSEYSGLAFENYNLAPEFKLINHGHTGRYTRRVTVRITHGQVNAVTAVSLQLLLCSLHWHVSISVILSSNRLHQSYDVTCLEVNREDYQNSTVLCCVVLFIYSLLSRLFLCLRPSSRVKQEALQMQSDRWIRRKIRKNRTWEGLSCQTTLTSAIPEIWLGPKNLQEALLL